MTIGKENNSSEEFDDDRVKPSSVPKKSMEASELLAKHARGRRINAASSSRGVDDVSMKYSSLSSQASARPPSAKTISNECFPMDSSTSSSSSPESLLVENNNSGEDQGVNAESYILDEKDASPESRKIMTEMEQVYQSSPIPKSYLESPLKKSSVLPEIELHPKASLVEVKPIVVQKKCMEASALLAKQGVRRKGKGRQNKGSAGARSRTSNAPSTKSCAATKAAYGGSKQNSSRPLSSADASHGKSNGADRNGRRNSTAPNDTGGSKPSDWDNPQEKGLAKAKTKPAALSVQREKKQRNQRKTASNEADGRRMLDKRTARLRYADDFQADILQHRQRLSYLNNGSNHSDKIGSMIQDRGMNGVSIAIRKRPIFEYELDRGDYDIVSIDNTNESSHDVCIIHNCLMHADMKQMLMKPTRYPVTAAFDEHCDDDDIYRHIAEPLVLEAANEGVATILMYGQTGCGKSHTMSGIETRTVYGLFQAIESKFIGECQSDRPEVSMQFVELCGSKECNDLLVRKTGEVKLVDDEDGSVRLLNAASCEVKSPEDLLAKIMLAKGRRATEATEKNGVSSRSHAVCQIQVKYPNKNSKRGLLTLIDCAGSERRHDSMYHSSERQKESAEINASLYALKECIRARASKNKRIPFRSSSLTRILKESFERDGARLCVIACVAPNATDCEHSMETLKTVASIVGVDDQIKEEKVHVVTSRRPETRPASLPPKQWDHKHLMKFLAHKKMKVKLISEKHDGKALMKMGVPQMRAQLFEDKDKDLAQKLFDMLRKENVRVAEVQRKERAILKMTRKGSV